MTPRYTSPPLKPLQVNRQQAEVELRQAPDHVQEFVENHRAPVRDVVRTVYGRGEAVARLAGYVLRSADEGDPKNALPGITVMAAPGAGKTVLVNHLETELREMELGVVEVTPEHLTSAEGLAAAIRNTEPWKRRKTIRDTLQSIREIAKKGADVGINSDVTVMLAGHGIPVPYMQLDALERVLSKLDRDEVPTVEETLQLLNHSTVKGTVLLLDEAQSLNAYPKTTPAGKCASLIIRTLANVPQRADAGVPRVTIMMFGAGDTRDVVGELGSYDPVDERLSPLTQNDVWRVIREHIDLGAGKDDALRVRACDLWLDPLTADYGDWTRHAAGAARSAEAMLKEFKHEAIEQPWGWAALIRLADRTRNRVYERMHEEATRQGVPDELQHAVLQALVRQPDGRLAKETYEKLTRVTIDRIYGAGTAATTYANTSNTFETMMNRGMRRAGMIDDVLTETGKPTHYVHAPVPSTRAFAAGYPPPNLSDVLEHIAAAGLNTEKPAD